MLGVLNTGLIRESGWDPFLKRPGMRPGHPFPRFAARPTTCRGPFFAPVPGVTPGDTPGDTPGV